jgi:hypothetical protein
MNLLTYIKPQLLNLDFVAFTPIKKCTKCGEIKPFSKFHKNKGKRFGIKHLCKNCNKIRIAKWKKENPDKVKEQRKKYYKENPEKVKEKNKKYREENPDKVKEYMKKYREENPDKVKEYKKKYYKENPDKVKEQNKKYREENPDKIKEQRKKYYKENPDKVKEQRKKYREENPDKVKEQRKKYREENPDKVKEYMKKYREENPDKVKEQRKKYKKRKYTKDQIYRTNELIRSRIRKFFNSKGSTKNKKTLEMLGTTIENVNHHLESQFKDGMTWENQGKVWHIDHKVPLSLAKTEEEAYKLNHYTNLQPLFGKENLMKRNKLLPEHEELYKTLLNR